MRVGTSVRHPIGAVRDLPQLVGGKTFKSLKDFEKLVAKGAGILPPGEHVTIKLGKPAAGARVPKVVGFNKDSPFSVKMVNGNIVISAKATAALGAKDRLAFEQKPLTAPGTNPKGTLTPFTLEVGIGHIHMG